MEFAGGDGPIGMCRLTFDQESVPAVRAAYRRYVQVTAENDADDGVVSYFEQHICQWSDTRPNDVLTPYPHEMARVLEVYRHTAEDDIDKVMKAVERAYRSDEPAEQSVIDRVRIRYELAAQAGKVAAAIKVHADPWRERRLRAGLEL